MNSTLLPSAKLAPQYHLPDPSTSAFFPSHILLGQERVVDTFKLMSKIDSQHLFLADFLGVDRPLFIDALVTQANTPSNHYLVATKKPQEDGDIQFKWQQTLPPEHVGIIAKQESLCCYLQGTIRRADLLGKMIKTDKSSVYKPGALATNHFVFICLTSLWQRESLWDLLMQIIHDGFYRINNELTPIPLNCKIVLVGSGLSYSQLRVEDRNFNRHFPLLAEMSNEVDLTQHPESSYVQWLNVLAHAESVELELSSLLPLFWYSSRLVEHQQRLSLSMLEFRQLLGQAKAYSGQSVLNASAIAKALEKLKFRHNSSEVYSAQSFDDNFINLPTKGAMVGQINALTVIDTGDYTYGEPARITSSVHYGDGEVADIERKSELGGNIHAKGMMILSACLYRIFGRDAPLHLNANIVFEQSYQEIDGDSASLAEYCCLMSAIAEQPIIQSLAVTGALDQFGNVQAIGGVNEKIEGFFNLCQRRGLTGEQGVIMPKANVLQLNLEPVVIEAIDTGLFHIHAIEHMDQAVELLMQMPAGVANEENDFAENTLYGLVQQRLDKLAGQDDDDVELNFFAKLLARLRII
ncbi:MAG: AAA family ATPase [Shewanella psychromarinicola]|jgi:Lon-like ATP-dependent protease|uniref:AAA family ATPase n=1 Tax=Shewanella TaxID=22 RepID=UPI000C33770B|nr:AAA family ATPase [Shewanella sp. Actino-trap-3]PKG80393.1 ATP-dependent protease [Shewanella sp. Actino-trap-3]